jgi:hypothetical protein
MEPNNGTGAGGSKTNLLGKKFEDKTDNESRLIEIGYKTIALSKKHHYLVKKDKEHTSYFLKQGIFKMFFREKFNIDVFRWPDECYVTVYKNGDKVIKVLEKKEQRVEGSVENKLWCGNSFKREYQIVLGEEFTVHYGFCVNDFLKKKVVSDLKKYKVLNKILAEDNIDVLYGDDEDYFDKLNDWIIKVY